MDNSTIRNLAIQICQAFARSESVKLPAMRKTDFERLMQEVRAVGALQAA